jgi:hypothetical protein
LSNTHVILAPIINKKNNVVKYNNYKY